MPKQSTLPVVPFPPVRGDESLPPDLQYALRAASWAAGAAESLVLVALVPKRMASVANPIITKLRQQLPAARLAVVPVAVEIATARQSVEPILSGGIAAPTWHELAVSFAARVLKSAEEAATDYAWIVPLLLPDADYRVPLKTIRKNWGRVTAALAGVKELGEEWRAALRLETIRAADARRYEQSFNGTAVAAGPSKRKVKPRRGRPVDTDTKRDAQIYDAWHYRNADGTKHYCTYAELAKAFGLTRKQVELIIDRERKRRN